MVIEKINTQLVGLPPNWMSRAVSKGGAMGNATEIKKLLGEPIPQIVDPDDLSPELKTFFGAGGILERIRKKLAEISRRKSGRKKGKKGGQILPAKNTIASVDDDDNIYVGVNFLQENLNNENIEGLLAGILAHEWGHMMSDLPKGVNWSHMTWDQLHAIRRDEEGGADGFAGRAMCLMGYNMKPMIKFLSKNDKRRKEKKLPCHKYHNHATRVAILEESFKAEENAIEVAKRLFFQGKDSMGPKVGKIIGAG